MSNLSAHLGLSIGGTHLEFPALENVAVRTATLPGSAADRSVQPAGGKLRLDEGINLRVCGPTSQPKFWWCQNLRTLLALLKLALDVVRLLFLLLTLDGSILLCSLLGHGLGVLSNKAKFQSTYPSMEEKG